MDIHSAASRDDLHHFEMDIKHIQGVQINHSDRLLRLEKRQADDAALKSVWTSPFPSVLSGTPQQGPVSTPSAEVFEDFDDDHGHNLLGSLHLEPDEEPVRRGASRANSVRFDVSAIQGSNWAQGSRSSGEFGPARPSSGLGSHPMMERSLSHKSDGRHSSAGHSVHSMHSVPSGRTSSLGLDTNFMIGDQDDESPLEIPEPPPGLFILGTVPSIIRCWLNENFSHSALLYAVVCTGSQKSVLDFSLVKELGLINGLQKDVTGRCYIRLPVYLPEAVVTQQPTSRANSPDPRLPTLTANFEIVGMNQPSGSERKKGIRIFLGSDTLRAHSADLLFSQNLMTLYGDDRNKLSVPFVRPEDDSLFKNLCTTNVLPERIELKATAPSFTPIEQKAKDNTFSRAILSNLPTDEQSTGPIHITTNEQTDKTSKGGSDNAPNLDDGAVQDSAGVLGVDIPRTEESRVNHQQFETSTSADSDRRESSGAVWGSWRGASGSAVDSDSNRENSTTSGYHRTGRGGRSMKVLKPSKVSQFGRSTSAVRNGTSYEPPIRRGSGEARHKGQGGHLETNGPLRWESKRTISDEKVPRELRTVVNMQRSPNPIGGASAFAWMNPNKSKANATTAE